MSPPEPLSPGENDPTLVIPSSVLAAARSRREHSPARDHPVGASRWTPPQPDELAALLPSFEILRILGRGGMGAVYLGRDRKLDRLVAIKLLPPELSSEPSYVDRFMREAKALAKLDHHGIIHIHAFDQTPAGHLYFVMEYVDGVDLHRVIHPAPAQTPDATQPGLLPWTTTLEIISRICDALQYAHDKGIVHRDIKPANVILAVDGRVKVADFGIARPAETDAASASMTQTGTIMGTPDYMAPEQREGHPADHRADIYALGVMFYEMLTGLIPRGAFPPPSRRVRVDIRLDEVVLRALQSEPDERYQRASEVKIDVVRIQTTPPQLPPLPRPPVEPPVPPPPPRHTPASDRQPPPMTMPPPELETRSAAPVKWRLWQPAGSGSRKGRLTPLGIVVGSAAGVLLCVWLILWIL